MLSFLFLTNVACFITDYSPRVFDVCHYSFNEGNFHVNQEVFDVYIKQNRFIELRKKEWQKSLSIRV